jgi:hypothetical protein
VSLFEIELNKDFKILNSSVFLNEQDFKKYYKSNKLNDYYEGKAMTHRKVYTIYCFLIWYKQYFVEG